MKKGQYLAEVVVQDGESLLTYINETIAMCRKENSPVSTEVHQIISSGLNKYVILINFYF